MKKLPAPSMLFCLLLIILLTGSWTVFAGAADLDLDGVLVEDGDCDNNDPLRSPLLSEFCDGKDNDCDGAIDEDSDPDNDGITSCGTGCVIEYDGSGLPQDEPTSWIRTVNPVAQVLSESITGDQKLYTHVAWSDSPPDGMICINCHYPHASDPNAPPPQMLIQGADYWLLSYELPLTDLSNIIGTTIEARIHNLSADGLGLSISDGTYTETLVIGQSGLRLLNSGGYYPMDTTAGFHNYRMTMQGSTVTVYVDGEAVLEGFSPQATSDKLVKFGHIGHATLPGVEAIWEYVTAYPGVGRVICSVPDCSTQYPADDLPQSSTPIWTQTVNNVAQIADESITPEGYLHSQVIWTSSPPPEGVCSACHAPHSGMMGGMLLLPGVNYWLMDYETPVTTLSNSQGTTLDARVHNVNSGDLGLSISDGTYTETLLIGNTRIRLLNSGGTYLMDTTDGFHLYSLSIVGTSIAVHVDGVMVLTGTASVTSSDKSVKFGHFAHVNGVSEAYWDLVRVYSSSGTVICPSGDNCPAHPNPDQLDSDADGSGDVCDTCPADPTDTCAAGKTASGTVGSAGDVLTTQDGDITMDIPPGALNDPTSISITGIGTNYELTTNLGPGTAVYGVTIKPDGQTFDVPVTLTFRWNDADNNGVVDGTALNEAALMITKDGTVISGPCGSSPGCDTALNEFAVTVTSLSEFTLLCLKPKGTTEIYINPPVLNLKSKRKYVTMHIEPSEKDSKVSSAIITAINGEDLSEPIPSATRPKAGDHDDDGIRDYMVKFPFIKLSGHLKSGRNKISVKVDISDGLPQAGTVTLDVKSNSKKDTAIKGSKTLKQSKSEHKKKKKKNLNR